MKKIKQKDVGITPEVIRPYNSAGEALSPYEAATGVPLPIYQSDTKIKQRNRHHAYFLERDYKTGGLGLRAVRFSRLQKGNKQLHSLYHEMIAGTEIPGSDRDLFNQTVLGYAGYVPRYAVDVSRGEIDVVELNQNERDNLRRQNVFQIERNFAYQAEIGSFLVNYAIWQDYDFEKQNEIEKFLSIRHRHIKRKPELRTIKEQLAIGILDEAFEVAIEPLNPTYEEAKKERALRVGSPVCALTLVRNYVTGHLHDYIEPLHHRLAMSYGA